MRHSINVSSAKSMALLWPRQACQGPMSGGRQETLPLCAFLLPRQPPGGRCTFSYSLLKIATPRPQCGKGGRQGAEVGLAACFSFKPQDPVGSPLDYSSGEGWGGLSVFSVLLQSFLSVLEPGRERLDQDGGHGGSFVKGDRHFAGCLADTWDVGCRRPACDWAMTPFTEI